MEQCDALRLVDLDAVLGAEQKTREPYVYYGEWIF